MIIGMSNGLYDSELWLGTRCNHTQQAPGGGDPLSGVCSEVECVKRLSAGMQLFTLQGIRTTFSSARPVPVLPREEEGSCLLPHNVFYDKMSLRR